MVENKSSLGVEVMKLYKADKWDRGWVVLTDLVDSSALTVAISSDSSSAITFEADASIPRRKSAS